MAFQNLTVVFSDTPALDVLKKDDRSDPRILKLADAYEVLRKRQWICANRPVRATSPQ